MYEIATSCKESTFRCGSHDPVLGNKTHNFNKLDFRKALGISTILEVFGKVKVTAMTDDETAIRNVIETWCRASESGDMDAIAPLMADDVVFLTPGREPFGKQEFFEASRQSAGKVKISVNAEVIEVRVEGNLGYCRLKLTVTVTPQDGGPAKR